MKRIHYPAFARTYGQTFRQISSGTDYHYDPGSAAVFRALCSHQGCDPVDGLQVPDEYDLPAAIMAEFEYLVCSELSVVGCSDLAHCRSLAEGRNAAVGYAMDLAVQFAANFQPSGDGQLLVRTGMFPASDDPDEQVFLSRLLEVSGATANTSGRIPLHVLAELIRKHDVSVGLLPLHPGDDSLPPSTRSRWELVRGLFIRLTEQNTAGRTEDELWEQARREVVSRPT